MDDVNGHVVADGLLVAPKNLMWSYDVSKSKLLVVFYRPTSRRR